MQGCIVLHSAERAARAQRRRCCLGCCRVSPTLRDACRRPLEGLENSEKFVLQARPLPTQGRQGDSRRMCTGWQQPRPQFAASQLRSIAAQAERFGPRFGLRRLQEPQEASNSDRHLGASSPLQENPLTPKAEKQKRSIREVRCQLSGLLGVKLGSLLADARDMRKIVEALAIAIAQLKSPAAGRCWQMLDAGRTASSRRRQSWTGAWGFEVPG